MKQSADNKKLSLIKDINLTTLGWELALPIFIGALIGYFLGRYTEIHYLIIIGCILLGIGIGYYNIYKYIEIEMLRLKQSKKANTPEGTAS